MKYVHREIKENVNISKHSPLQYLFSRLFVLVVVVCFVYFVLCGALEIAIRCVPEKLESVLAASFFPMTMPDDSSDPESQKRLERILSELLVYYPGKDKKFQIYLRKQDEVNAFAFPGNNIIFLSGLVVSLSLPKVLNSPIRGRFLLPLLIIHQDIIDRQLFS